MAFCGVEKILIVVFGVVVNFKSVRWLAAALLVVSLSACQLPSIKEITDLGDSASSETVASDGVVSDEADAAVAASTDDADPEQQRLESELAALEAAQKQRRSASALNKGKADGDSDGSGAVIPPGYSSVSPAAKSGPRSARAKTTSAKPWARPLDNARSVVIGQWPSEPSTPAGSVPPKARQTVVASQGRRSGGTAPGSVESRAAASSKSGAWAVQVGAFSDLAALRKQMSQGRALSEQRFPGRRVDEKVERINGGRLLRALFVDLNEADARSLCDFFHQHDLDCLVKRPAGQ